jgi:acetylornithine deacetylase/succinyl-diaminopimelate desuccinylase-like protein
MRRNYEVLILQTEQNILRQQKILLHMVRQQFEHEVTFLQRLVRAKSENRYTAETSPANAPVEAEVAAVIVEKMQQLGWQGELHGVSEQRQNVLCVLPGQDPAGRTLILTIHMDTVPASSGYTRDPWGAQIEGRRLYGLGAADAKAQIAAFISAVSALQEAHIELAGTIKLAFVVDEETGACSSYGTRYLLEQGLLDGDAAIIGEPGEDKIAVGHRGLYRFKIRTRGEAVHTGLKEWEMKTRGHNAAIDMARIIQALSTCELPLIPSPAFPNRKNVLTFPTLLQGGEGINIVPEQCEAYGDVRLLPHLKAEEIRGTIERCLAPLSIPYELEEIVYVPAAETPLDAPIVQALSESIRDITGQSLRLEGAGPACDGWMFRAQGIETICGYGVQCGGVHSADEWIDLESLQRVTEVYARTILKYFGQG